MQDHKPQWMIDHEAEDARRFDDIKMMLEAQNIAFKPVIDAYTKSMTVWDFLQLAGKLIISLGLLLGASTAIFAFYQSHK